MAVTKIHSIKSTLHKSVAYICNPDKTDGQILISSFGCSPQTAEYDFRFALSKTKGRDANLAYHLIQSFAPGEVSFEEAHTIGMELAGQLLEGRYSYIVSTHIDKMHCHNHILFCAADNVDHRKYHDCRESYRYIRQLSDKLCLEHNLSVIIPDEHTQSQCNSKSSQIQRTPDNRPWDLHPTKVSKRDQMRQDIDDAIAQSVSYEVFLILMKSKGYEVKGTSPSGKDGRYIAFRPHDRERFVRGSEKTLGAEYTRERIIQRIDEGVKERSQAQTVQMQTQSTTFPKFVPCEIKLPEQFQKKRSDRIRAKLPTALIQISEAKLENNPGLKAWQQRQNLKIAAHAFAVTESIEELKGELATHRHTARELQSTIASIDKEIKSLQETIFYIRQYQETLPFEKRYHAAKNKEGFEQKYHSQLRLHEGASVYLQNQAIRLSSKLSAEKYQMQLNRMQHQKKELKEMKEQEEREVKENEVKLKILEEYVYKNNTISCKTIQRSI